MTCPRCSQPLSTLSLDGRAARYCERCGFVGVETVHERDAPSRESWDDAIARFRERAVREAREGDGDWDADVGGAGGADSGKSTDGDGETEAERDEAGAEDESGDATEDVVDADDDEATDRESTDSQLTNGEDGDRGDRAGDE